MATGHNIPGLPDRSDFADPQTLLRDKLLDYVLQEHLAERAGRHFDLRFGNKQTGLHSWAVPKGLPAPGERRLAVQQPRHEHSYKDYEGEIKEGYGKGKVKVADKGQVVIDEATPDKIKFTVAHRKAPENYTLVKTDGKNWLLMNNTPQTSDIHKVHKKVHYNVIPEDQVDKLLNGEYAVSKKIDGAAALFHVLKNRVEAYSYRLDSKGRPIIHTDRIGGLRNLKIPKELQGKMLRGEIYGMRGGKAIPPQELGGILNSSLANALRKKQEQNVQLKAAVFNILGDDRPYSEKLKDIKSITSQLKGTPLEAAPVTTNPVEARNWFEKIKAGKDPLTSEGIVATPLAGGKPTKVKFRPEADVIVRNIFPAVTKGTPRAGGFEYSLPGSSDIVGKVGTGFNHEVLKDMLKNPNKYIGRRARINAQGQFPSGAYRAPGFIALHEDYPSLNKSAALTDDDVKEYMDKYYVKPADPAHGVQHIEAVRAAMRRLAERTGYRDKATADAAALLHDIGLHKSREEHHTVGADMVLKDKRLRTRFPENRLRAIANAVREHRASKGRPKSVLAKMLNDADRLSSFTHPGSSLLRAYRYGQKHEPHLSDDEQLLRAAEHQVEKYGPKGYGANATYMPGSRDYIIDMNKDVARNYKRGDVEALRKLKEEAEAAELGKTASINPVAPYNWKTALQPKGHLQQMGEYSSVLKSKGQHVPWYLQNPGIAPALGGGAGVLAGLIAGQRGNLGALGTLGLAAGYGLGGAALGNLLSGINAGDKARDAVFQPYNQAAAVQAIRDEAAKDTHPVLDTVAGVDNPYRKAVIMGLLQRVRRNALERGIV